MIFDVIYFIWDCFITLVDIAMMLRNVPSLLLNTFIFTSAGMFVTKLRPPKGGYRLPAAGKCIAHRGAGLDAPENTMAAFKYCVEKGCKHLEIDVRTTKDGIPIVWHDMDINGTPIVSHTWDQIKNIPAARGNLLQEKFSDARPCTLEEALEYLIPKGVSIIIDLKVWDPPTCSVVAKCFSRWPAMYDSCMISAIIPLAVYRIRKMDSKIVAGLAFQPKCFSSINYSAHGSPRQRFADSYAKHFGARMVDYIHSVLWWSGILTSWVGCSVVLLHKDLASPWVINLWQKRGYEVALWTVNQPVEKRMITKLYGVPYLTDTLIGEDLTNGFVK